MECKFVPAPATRSKAIPAHTCFEKEIALDNKYDTAEGQQFLSLSGGQISLTFQSTSRMLQSEATNHIKRTLAQVKKYCM